MFSTVDDKIFQSLHISFYCSDKKILVKHNLVSNGDGLHVNLTGNDACLGSQFSIQLSRSGMTELKLDVDTKDKPHPVLILRTDISCAPCSMVVWAPDFGSLVKASDPVDVWFGISKLDL